MDCLTGGRTKEGIRSFFEKRSPNFKGTLEEETRRLIIRGNRVDVQVGHRRLRRVSCEE